MKVKELMTTNVMTVSKNSSVKETANYMKSLNVGSVPVCDDNNKIVGMVTDRDIVLRNVTEGSSPNSSIDNVMTQNVTTVTPDTDVHEAARLMSEKQIRRLPVVENGNIIGILSIGDLAVKNILVDDAGVALSGISEQNKNT